MNAGLEPFDSLVGRALYETEPGKAVADIGSREELLAEAAEDACDNGGVMPANTHARLAEAGYIVIS